MLLCLLLQLLRVQLTQALLLPLLLQVLLLLCSLQAAFSGRVSLSS